MFISVLHTHREMDRWRERQREIFLPDFSAVHRLPLWTALLAGSLSWYEMKYSQHHRHSGLCTLTRYTADPAVVTPFRGRSLLSSDCDAILAGDLFALDIRMSGIPVDFL